jgi:hypothetical protein
MAVDRWDPICGRPGPARSVRIYLYGGVTADKAWAAVVFDDTCANSHLIPSVASPPSLTLRPP